MFQLIYPLGSDQTLMLSLITDMELLQNIIYLAYKKDGELHTSKVICSFLNQQL